MSREEAIDDLISRSAALVPQARELNLPTLILLLEMAMLEAIKGAQPNDADRATAR
jgi:hypothetical protein